MHGARQAAERRRAQEFAAFVGGAAGRLLHLATLLSCDDAEAGERLLCEALARAYLRWPRLRGEDPYAYTLEELVTAYHRRAAARPWHRDPAGGRLSALSPLERLVLVLRMSEGMAEAQVAALLGLAPDRVAVVCARACAVVRGAPRLSAATGGER
ncbi:sigma factor-like helix-turn-helix DNA-binding protein [Streptomyces capparidis]